MPCQVVPYGKKCAEEGADLPDSNTPPQKSRRNALRYPSIFPRIRHLIRPERDSFISKELISLSFEGFVKFLWTWEL
jgi:hypothetical protein